MSNMNILKEEVLKFEVNIEFNNINEFDSVKGKYITGKAYVSKVIVNVLRGENESVCIINPFQIVLNGKFNDYDDNHVLAYVSKQFDYTLTESQDIAKLYHSIKEVVEKHFNNYMVQLFSAELCNFYKPFDCASPGQLYNQAAMDGHINFPIMKNILKSCNSHEVYKGCSISIIKT